MREERYIIFILVFILSLTLVNGAGGGGGGDGSNSVDSGSGGSSNEFFSSLQCDDKGVISFLRGPTLKSVTVLNLQDNSILEVYGNLEGNKFSSEEAVMVSPGSYVVKDTLFGDQRVNCPGLRFSCKVVSLKLKECSYSEDKIIVRFEFENASLTDLKFEFRKPDSSKLSYQKAVSFSKELKNTTITKGDDGYTLQVLSAPNVTKLQVSHTKCIGKHYVYSTIDCVKNGLKKDGISGKELKCGGYLSIKDRVKCRIELREEERNEYENFYPEECKAREDKENCLRIYQSVQKCLGFQNGEPRINCVREQLNLGDIKQEKGKCGLIKEGNKGECENKLREKVYSLIKFRFYNLEEIAEEMMEDEKLNKEDVIDFVLKIENAKLEFNLAKSKEERKEIILKVREYWNGMLSKSRK